MTAPARVVAVSASPSHAFSKHLQDAVTLVEGRGIVGDAHNGVTVKHRSRVAQDPNQPNLRQVHLIHQELFAELAGKGFRVLPGDLGENITTAGLDLLALPTGTRLRLGPEAVVEVTGLRNPCKQIEHFQPGLMKAVLDKADDGTLVRKSGVMAIVIAGGAIHPNDAIAVTLPDGPREPLRPV